MVIPAGSLVLTKTYRTEGLAMVVEEYQSRGRVKRRKAMPAIWRPSMRHASAQRRITASSGSKSRRSNPLISGPLLGSSQSSSSAAVRP